MSRRMIAPGFVEDALVCMRTSGRDPARLLAEVGLPSEICAPISNEQYGRLWLLIAQAMGDEFFGLAARPMRPGSFAVLCHSVLHAQTLEQALRRALRFMAIVLDDPRGELRIDGGEAIIGMSDGGPPRSAFAYRTFWLILMGIACWLIGRRIPMRRLDFACAAPADRLDHHQFFATPAHFSQPESRLVFNASYLRMRPIRTEPALKSFLRGAPANILVRYRQDQGMSARVRSRLGELAPGDWPPFERLAEELNMSPATLRRRLRADGQSFAAIKGELRMVLAQHMLNGSRKTLSAIATDLGYSEPSAFHRAFSRYMGQSPNAFRDRGQRGADSAGKPDELGAI